MAFMKKVVGDVEVNKELILLLLIGGLYGLAIAMSNTFVNIYLWKQSGSLLDIALYNLAIVVLQPLAFILAGKLAKKIDRVIVLRLGVSFLAAFYVTVLYVGTDAAQFLLLLGGLLGIGYGFYWLGFNVLTFEITEPETRDFFNGFLGILNSLAGMVGPIVAGFIISTFYRFVGYKIVFTISLILFSSAVLLSFFLKRRAAEGHYLFKQVLAERKTNKNWSLVLKAHFFQGLREGTFVFVISVLVFITTGSELALGAFGLVNSAVAFVCYYVVSRFIKKEQRLKSILIGGLILYFSVTFIIFDISYIRLIMYAATIAIAYPLLLVPYISITYDVIGQAKDIKVRRIEYIVVRELFLNAGRIVSILLFIAAVSFFNEKQSVPVLLALIGSGHTFIYWFVKQIEISPKTHAEAAQQPVTQPILKEGDGESPA
jgi:MFS transporter, YQGE family, putative transporter